MKNVFFAIILSLSVSLLISCQQSDSKGSPTVPSSPNPITMGPSDGGGGDTCNGKMIESYKVEIHQLEEYQKYLNPIFIKLSEGNKAGAPVALPASGKNWYIVDCKLQDIPKERKGLYMETYQTAIHTDKEIFIDSKSYGKMEEEEKAKLLLHELIMGFYLTKFQTLEEICKMTDSCRGDVQTASKWKMFRPIPYRPLNSQDHEKIRAVTAWIWENRNNISHEEIAKILKRNEFDHRFEWSDEATSKEVLVEPNALVRMFKKYQWAQKFPQHCQFDEQTNLSQSACKTNIDAKIEEATHPGSQFKYKNLRLQVHILRESDQHKFEYIFNYPIVQEKIKLYQNRMGGILSSAALAFQANWPNNATSELKEGSRSQMLFFMLNLSDPENPEIYQVYLQNYVWYSFETIIVERGGHKNKETYGYANLIVNESENIFFENELPYFFKDSFIKSKVFLFSNLAD